MRPKSILLLVLALGCGLIASIGISQVMERRGSGGDEGERVQVLVAKVEIPAGEAIKPEMVALQSVPKDMVQADTFTKIEDVEGKRPSGKLLVGEIIREGNLGEAKAAPIPDGFRVNTIRATADRGGNLLKPGDRVDVQVYVRAGAVPQIDEPTLQTFLTDVRVYAVDTKTNSTEEEQGSASTRTVSLLVKPDQAAKLTYASQIGQIQLVMRGTNDTAEGADTEPVSWDVLVNKSDSPGDRKAADKKPADATTPTPAADTSFADKLREEMAALQAQLNSKNATPAATPARNQFVMLEVRGDEVMQYTFNDTTKPPVNWAPYGNAGDGKAPAGAPANPGFAPDSLDAVEPPAAGGPQLRINPMRSSKNKVPVYGGDEEEPIE
jgi:pilus assembly protein CpaB